jgi:hypothetical protein
MQLSDGVCQKHCPLVFLAGLLLVMEFEWNMLSVKCSYSASQCINKQKKETIFIVNKLHLLILFILQYHK